MTNTAPLSIRAIAACTTLAECKAILADRRQTLIVLETTYGVSHPTTMLFSADYDAMTDEMIEMLDTGALSK